MNEPNGRDPRSGIFLKGNKFGHGYVHAKRMSELRKALYTAVDPADIIDVYKAMLAAAKGGDVAAAKLIFDHLIGRPPQDLVIASLGPNEAPYVILRVPPGARARARPPVPEPDDGAAPAIEE